MKRKERKSEKEEFVVKKVGTIDGRQPLWTVGDGKTRSEGGSKVKRESQARGQSEKENILEKRGILRGHTKVDSLHVTVTVDFLKSRLSLSTFLLRQSTHCRRIQCKILR